MNFRGERLMQEKTFKYSLQNIDQLSERENQSQTHYRYSASLIMAGGLFCVLLGFLLLGVYNASGETVAILKQSGLGLIFIPTLIFGFCANFIGRHGKEKTLQP